MSQIKFSIKKISTGMMLTIWEDAPVERDRIRPFNYKMNFRCLNMTEAKSRLQLVTGGDFGFDVED